MKVSFKLVAWWVKREHVRLEEVCASVNNFKRHGFGHWSWRRATKRHVKSCLECMWPPDRNSLEAQCPYGIYDRVLEKYAIYLCV